MRYLYVKNGDAAEQLQRIAQSQFAVAAHGPDAFVSDFLAATSDDEVYVLSRGRRSARFQAGKVTAETRDGGSSAVTKLLRRPIFAFALVRRILAFRPDRILCGSTGSQLLICCLAGSLFGIPVVHSRHNSLREKSGSWMNDLRRLADIWLLRKATAIVVHGPYLLAQVIGAGVSAERVFEFEVSFPEEASLPKDLRHKVILYLGRMEIDKGITDLMLAALPILQADPGHKLVYVGRGSATERLQRDAANSPCSHQIEIKGPVPHGEVIPIMRSAFVVVTPTRTVFPEGRCMVVLESLVAGVPVIAPDHGPFPFAVVHEQNGLLFQSDSVDSLSAALQRVFSDLQLSDRLRDGATRTSDQLRNSDARFAKAVFKAFEAA